MDWAPPADEAQATTWTPPAEEADQSWTPPKEEQLPPAEALPDTGEPDAQVLSPMQLAGTVLDQAGKFAKRVAGAYAFEAIGEPGLQKEQLTAPDGETPIEQGIQALPTAGKILPKAVYGLVDSAPRLAGVMAAQAAGVPAPIAAGAMFGTSSEGFSPKQAVIAAVLPAVGKYGGEFTGLIAKRLGVTETQAVNVIKGLGGMGGAAGLLAAQDVQRIQSLPEAQRKDAYVDAVANVVGQSMLGPMGVEFEHAPEPLDTSLSDSEFGGAAVRDEALAAPADKATETTWTPPAEELDAPPQSSFQTGDWVAPEAADQTVQTSAPAEADAWSPPAEEADEQPPGEAVETIGTPAEAADLPAASAVAPEEQLSFEDRISNWADQTIAGAQGRLNVGVDPTVLAAYAVKGALLIKQGIVDFGRWSAEMVREHGEPVRPYLASLFQQAGGLAQGEGLREFGKKLQVNPEISPEAKEAVGEYTYTIGNNADAAAAAKQILAAHGTDAAARLFANPRASIDPDLRVILGGELIDQLGRDYRVALSKGDSAGADALLSKQVDVADERLRQGTDLAKGLQANKVYDALSTAGILKQADGMFGDAGQQELDRLAPVTDQVREGFRAANDAAVAGTIRDAKVNDAARAAVNDAVEGSAATRKGVIVEVTGAFAESPEIVRQARDQLRGQLDRILQTQGVPRAARSGEQLRAILDDTAKRAAGIAAGHFQGAELGKTLAEKFRERLNLSPYEAQRLANVMEREYGRMVDAARAKLPARIAAARARQAAPFDPNEFNQTALDKEIARQLKEQNLRLGDLVKQHSTVVDAAGRSIGERVVKDAGLTGPRADALQAAFDKRFAELATAAKQRALKQLTDAGVKLPKPLRGDRASELIKLTNLGAFTNEKFNGELSKRLDLPVLTPELKREIAARANALQGLPKGFQRDRAATELLDYISKQRGLKIWELPMAVWYANVLSHITTPAHVLVDNIPNLAVNTVVQALNNPRAIGRIPETLARGFGKGALQAAEVLKTGIVTGVKGRTTASKILELNPFTGPLSPLNNLKYVGRVLSAAHVATFKPAFELKELMVAHNVARDEGLTGSALAQRTADILGNTEPRVNAARAQATAEGAKGLDFRRRVDEILEQQRDAAVPGMEDAGLRYARQVTYLNEPYGVIGAVTKGIDAMQRFLGAESKVAGMAAQTAIPFKTIVGNLLNEHLNYFAPTAAVRYLDAKLRTGKLYGETADETAFSDLATKAIVGSIALGAVAAAVNSGKLKITGAGPRTAEQRRQLIAADGWRPNSMKIGDTYYSYMRTPLALPLTALSNYNDAVTFGNLGKQDLANRLTYALIGVPNAILHQSFLKAPGDLWDILNEQDPAVQVRRVQQMIAQTAAGFVSPGALMDVDRIFDPTQYSASDMAGMVRAQIPWARRENQPVINALGEPVTRKIFSGDFSTAKPDPLWTAIAAKQAWVPALPSTVIVGDKKDGPGNFRALTKDEIYKYAKISGAAIRQELLNNLGDLQTMPPEDAKAYVRKVTADARKEARGNFAP